MSRFNWRRNLIRLASIFGMTLMILLATMAAQASPRDPASLGAGAQVVVLDGVELDILNQGAYEGSNIIPSVRFSNQITAPQVLSATLNIKSDFINLNARWVPPSADGGTLSLLKCRNSVCSLTWNVTVQPGQTLAAYMPREVKRDALGFYPDAVQLRYSLDGGSILEKRS